jgi:hypothetical protein
MDISIYEVKHTRTKRKLNIIGNTIGAIFALIFLPVFYVLSILFPGNKNKREIKDINDIPLNWKLIINNQFIKVYESIIGDWPKELEFIDFHQGDEFVKKFRTDPEIEELNKYYFGDFMPYDIENNYIEYHNGLYIIAYPIDKNEPDNYRLFHLDFEARKLNLIKENVLIVEQVKYPDENSIEIVTKDADKQIVIKIKK